MDKLVSARLGDLVKVFIGGDAPKEYTKEASDENTVPIFSNGIEKEGLYGYTCSPKVEGDSVTISARGNVGAAFYRDKPFVPIVRLLALIPNRSLINAKYLYYLLKLDSIISTGAAQQQITAPQIKKHRITYFSDISYQNSIVAILSAYDSLIDNNQKRIKLLEQMAENLYKEWFVKFRFPGYENAEFEGGLPKEWKQVTLGDYANVIMGQSPESCFYNNDKQGLPFHQGVGSYGDFYLQDDVYSTEGKRIAGANSIIFSVRAPVGRINITLNRIILGRGVAGINAKNGNNAFLLWLLKNKFAKEDIIGNGAIFTSVTKDELLGQKILIPTKEIEESFNTLASNIEKEIRFLTLQKDNLTHQRDLLLPRLMSGKLSI